MQVKTIKTAVIKPGEDSLKDLLDKYIDSMPETSILVITSKLVSLCANTVQPANKDKAQLIHDNSSYYLEKSESKFGLYFTITQKTLIPSAGIDESNGGGDYILWVDDFQSVANQVRAYLKDRFKLAKVGVIITDSTCTPLRRGTVGICLAHSGFRALNDYRGKPDLFDRPFNVSVSNIAGGLSSAAVVNMGEGTESTPLAIISEVPFVDFQDRDPSQSELDELIIDKDEDLFEPFLSAVDWKKGGKD